MNRLKLIVPIGLTLLFMNIGVMAAEFYYAETICAEETIQLTKSFDDTGLVTFELVLPGNPEFGVFTRSLRYYHSFEHILPPFMPDGQLHYVRLKLHFRTPGNNDLIVTVDSLDLTNPHRRNFLVGPNGDDTVSIEDWPLDDGRVEIVLESSEHEFMVTLSDFDMLYIPANPTDVDDQAEGLPFAYELKTNHPNPFNPLTIIEFAIPVRSHVRILVYDLLGRKIRTLVDKEHSAGRHTIIWNGRKNNGEPAASGIYFYTIKSGDFVDTKRMILLK